MNILMLGCSYGVPNYFGPPGADAEDHIEYLLVRHGHTVHNCSKNGASNLTTLRRAEQYLQGESIEHPAYPNQYNRNWDVGVVDLIIWFHTELERDVEDCNFVYKKFVDFFNQLNCDVVIIGGAGDMLPDFTNLYQPRLFVPSWRQMILGSTIPTSHSVSAKNFADKNPIMNRAEMIDQAETRLQIIEAMQSSELFPDGCHPGTKPHQDLFDMLVKEKII